MAIHAFMHRPIYGGIFGSGRYALATVPCVTRGLHSLQYLVIEPGPGTVISVAEDKTEALSHARQILQATRRLMATEAANDPQMEQGELWPAEAFEQPAVRPPAARPVSRRRAEIYTKCEGKCHYCGSALSLDGKWHVEHALPRALGGLDQVGNLFASCPSCNLSKSDMTALEFVLRDMPGST